MIRINGVKIKTPKDAILRRYNLTKSGRVASGLMKMDLVAKKRKLEISYEIISGKDMQTILDLIDGNNMFFEVSYETPQGSGIMTCYVGEIPTKYYRRKSGWYWTDVQFSLIEQ